MDRSKLTPERIEDIRADAVLEAGIGIALLEIVDDVLIIRDTNDAFAVLAQYDVESLADKPLSTLFGPRTDRRHIAEMLNAARARRRWRETVSLETAGRVPLPVTFMLSPKSWTDTDAQFVIATVIDATDYVRARSVQRLSHDVSAIISHPERTDSQPMELAESMVRDFADWCIVHLRSADGHLELSAIANREGRSPIGDTALDVADEGIGMTFASGIPLLHQSDHAENPTLARQMEEILGEPVSAATSVPIASNSLDAFGTISWAITDDARVFHHEDVQAAEEVGAKYGHYLEENQIRESLARAVLAREGFMKAAGHELRTPLVSIKGYTQLLLRDLRRQSISEQRLESGLKAIDTSTSRLTDLMEDLFAVANPGINTLPLRLVTLDLVAFVRDFLTTTPSLTLAGHHIYLDEPEHSLMVRIDPARLAQVLFNVSINAVHFSPANSDIRFSSSRRDGSAIVAIRDSGRGLYPGEEASIFDPFSESRIWQGSEEQGLGIGLYISKQIVERHHGEIWAESGGSDQGTTFFIKLPLAEEVNPDAVSS